MTTTPHVPEAAFGNTDPAQFLGDLPDLLMRVYTVRDMRAYALAAVQRALAAQQQDYQRLMDKHNALHLNARKSRDRIAELEAQQQALATERERCAKLCEEAKATIWEGHDRQVRDTAETVCTNLAAAIRRHAAPQQAAPAGVKESLTAQAAPTVATVTECEACFTPDVCQLRGTCDHYAAERLRVAAPAEQTEAYERGFKDGHARALEQAPAAEAVQPKAVRLTPEEMDATWDEWFGAVGFQTQPGQATRRAFASAIERAVWDANGLGDSTATFREGDLVRKKSGSAWEGRVVGDYSTTLTPEGYAVESSAHPGSVQIYPVAALEKVE